MGSASRCNLRPSGCGVTLKEENASGTQIPVHWGVGGGARLRGDRRVSCSWLQRVVLAAWVAAGFVVVASEEAAAVTLKLAFSDGRPMTYGSACSGHGCLQRGADIGQTDAGGRVVLADAPDQIVEYRRDGVDLSLVSLGAAAGRLQAVGERTVVLPRLLTGTAPAIDAAEADVVSRINASAAPGGWRSRSSIGAWRPPPISRPLG